MIFRALAFSFLLLTNTVTAAYASGNSGGSPTPVPAAPAPTANDVGGGMTVDDLMNLKTEADRNEANTGVRSAKEQAEQEEKAIRGPSDSEFGGLIDDAKQSRNVYEKQTSSGNGMVDNYGSGPLIDVVTLKNVTDEFIDPNMQNLSKLMWRLGVLDLSDNTAVDNYMMINECELYERYYKNDIEWEKVRAAARQSLNDSIVTFPTKFEIVVPIALGRYNTERQYFEIQSVSKMTNVRRLDINMGNNTQVCREGAGNSIRGYPRNIILMLNRPFSFTRLPVGRQLAQMYIEDANNNQISLQTIKQANVFYDRPAFMRAKVTIVSLKEMVQGVQSGGPVAILIGQLEGVEIYADVSMQKLLYREDKKTKSLRQRRREQRESQPAPEEAAQTQPNGEAGENAQPQ